MFEMSRERLAVIWGAAILLLTGGAVAAGARVTAGNGILALVACTVPPAVMLLVWRPAPPTVAEVLHAVNMPPRERQ